MSIYCRKESHTGTLDEPPEPHFYGKRQLLCLWTTLNSKKISWI